jgi:hypothetical protein
MNFHWGASGRFNGRTNYDKTCNNKTYKDKMYNNKMYNDKRYNDKKSKNLKRRKVLCYTTYTDKMTKVTKHQLKDITYNVKKPK